MYLYLQHEYEDGAEERISDNNQMYSTMEYWEEGEYRGWIHTYKIALLQLVGTEEAFSGEIKFKDAPKVWHRNNFGNLEQQTK